LIELETSCVPPESYSLNQIYRLCLMHISLNTNKLQPIWTLWQQRKHNFIKDPQTTLEIISKLRNRTLSISHSTVHVLWSLNWHVSPCSHNMTQLWQLRVHIEVVKTITIIHCESVGNVSNISLILFWECNLHCGLLLRRIKGRLKCYKQYN
jgi:hypothetical protein